MVTNHSFFSDGLRIEDDLLDIPPAPTFASGLNSFVEGQIAARVLQVEAGAELAQQLQHPQLSLGRRAMGRTSEAFVLFFGSFFRKIPSIPLSPNQMVRVGPSLQQHFGAFPVAIGGGVEQRSVRVAILQMVTLIVENPKNAFGPWPKSASLCTIHGP